MSVGMAGERVGFCSKRGGGERMQYYLNMVIKVHIFKVHFPWKAFIVLCWVVHMKCHK